MRISDWSSDVCSSDLAGVEEGPEEGGEEHHLGGDEEDHPVAQAELDDLGVMTLVDRLLDDVAPPDEHRRPAHQAAGHQQPGGDEIGRASCRERVCQYV